MEETLTLEPPDTQKNSSFEAFMKETLGPDWNITNQRKNVIERFGNRNVEGLDVQRVENFIREKGQTVKPYVIVTSEDIPQLVSMLPSTHDLHLLEETQPNKPRSRGMYLPQYDLVVLVRDPRLEAENGQAVTEGLLVHELAHASTKIEKRLSTQEGEMLPFKARFNANIEDLLHLENFCESYFSDQDMFLEEGYADLLRGEYLGKYMAISNPDELLRGANQLELMIPRKYFIVVQGELKLPASAIAGRGLELLCEENPYLETILHNARKSLEELKKLAQELNKTSANLYANLLKKQNAESTIYGYQINTFIEKYNLINSLLSESRIKDEVMS